MTAISMQPLCFCASVVKLTTEPQRHGEELKQRNRKLGEVYAPSPALSCNFEVLHLG
jgi:hypothetical protein